MGAVRVAEAKILEARESERETEEGKGVTVLEKKAVVREIEGFSPLFFEVRECEGGRGDQSVESRSLGSRSRTRMSCAVGSCRQALTPFLDTHRLA